MCKLMYAYIRKRKTVTATKNQFVTIKKILQNKKLKFKKCNRNPICCTMQKKLLKEKKK